MNTKEKDKEILRLIKDDDSHRSFFFKRVSEPDWYFKLKGENFFDIKKIPGPNISDDGGAQFPGWLPLTYFERLVTKLDSKKHHEIISDLIDLLKTISAKKLDNPHVWSDFIRVLTKLPNELVEVEILDNISNWLESDYRNSLPSHEICENLLPKFLNEGAKKEDLRKSEIILKNILNLRKIESSGAYTEDKFKTLIDLYWLRHVLNKENLLEIIGEKLSSAIIFKLAANLREILYGQVIGKSLSSKFYLRFDFTEQGLKVSYDSDNDLENAIIVFIKDYQQLDVLDLTKQIVDGVTGESPGISIDFDAIEYFTTRLFTDHSTIWCNSLHKIKEQEIMRSEIKMIHVHLLMELVRIKGESNKADFLTVKDKLIGYEYRQPIFKRIVIYSISKTWCSNKDIFWDLVKNVDEDDYFSDSLLTKEIFYLLKENITEFNPQDRKILNEIIDKGPQNKKIDEDKDYTKYWRLQWYSALKEDAEYQKKYEKLSKELNINAEHFETLGEIQTRIGSVSPYSPDEIVDMGIPRLLEEIRKFKPGNTIDDPTIGGFGDAIDSAVAKEPSNFTNDLNKLLEAPFFCVYHFLTGFQRAWNNDKKFNWGQLLEFCFAYIETEPFKNNELLINDNWLNVTNESIIHQIGKLISVGTENDSTAFDKKHLPVAKKILKRIVPELEPVNDIEDTNMDYPTYSLNSKAGKVLIALINYSLRYARVHYDKEYDGPKWDDDLKDLFDECIKKGIIDSFILIGFYFKQLNYLDNKWLWEKVNEFIERPEVEWKAFMGGYLFAYPAGDEEIYKLMFPHYKRAISSGIPHRDFGYSSVVNHIAAFYLWDMESLEDDTLIVELIKTGKEEDLSRLPGFFWEIRDRVSDKQLKKLRGRILELWTQISSRVTKEDFTGKEIVLSNLSKLMKYFDRLDDSLAELVKQSAPYVNHEFNTPFYLEELNRMKNYSKSESIALHIGEIMQTMLKNFTPDFQETDIRDLVSYMYEFKQNKEVKEMADSICAEYAKRGKEFLRRLFNQNRS